MHVFEWWGGEYRPLAELIAEMDDVKRWYGNTNRIKTAKNIETILQSLIQGRGKIEKLMSDDPFGGEVVIEGGKELWK